MCKMSLFILLSLKAYYDEQNIEIFFHKQIISNF